jgi:hypothetical protein
MGRIPPPIPVYAALSVLTGFYTRWQGKKSKEGETQETGEKFSENEEGFCKKNRLGVLHF